MLLIYDHKALDRLSSPAPDHEGLLKFPYDPLGKITSSMTNRLEESMPRISLGTSEGLTLDFIFRPKFSEAFGPGGHVVWGLEDPGEYFHRGVPPTRFKPCDFLGLIVQETERPTVAHTLFLSEEFREAWRLGLKAK